jgi:membrane-associated phospholipid phosphatase
MKVKNCNTNTQAHIWLILICSLFSWISIKYLDKPLALFIHAYAIDQQTWLRIITEYANYVFSISLVILLICHYRQRLVIGLITIFYIGLNLQLTLLIKTWLKNYYGRYWPTTWFANNLSLINNHVYGFAGIGYGGSFPSGHLTFCSFCLYWWYVYKPQFKSFYFLLLLIMLVSMVALNYHFLGDCLAGVALGTSMAILTNKIYNLSNTP